MDTHPFSEDSTTRPRRAGAFARICLISLAFFGLAACGGGGSGGGQAGVGAMQTGQVVIGLTDAGGDFITYTVDVRSIQLTRANGDVVETIPLTTRIDFTQLTDLTELFTSATVPAGTYTAVSMTLDYTNAEIVVEDANGDPVQADAVDTDGLALGVIGVEIKLDGATPVVITPGIPAHVTLDFDLDASNEVDLATQPAEVTVQPFLFVTTEFEAGRIHRVQGVLAAVDESSGQVTVAVRPFGHLDGRFGEFTFDTSSETRYEIDGESFTGSAGLTALAELPEGAPVIAEGMVTNRVFTADVVFAGTSVPWTDGDIVKGVITARDGDEITVKGATFEVRDGDNDDDDEDDDDRQGAAVVATNDGHDSDDDHDGDDDDDGDHDGNGDDDHQGDIEFCDIVTVLIGPDTRVTVPGASDDVGLEALSVGSRVVFTGDRTGKHSLDATQGSAQLRLTDLAGEADSVDPLVVDLDQLSGRRLWTFDFSGTGTSEEDDADPNAYEIDTGTLSLASLNVGDLVQVRGLVSAFGAAPPDFVARTVIDVDRSSRAARFFAKWEDGTQTPFDSVAPNRLDLDLSDASNDLWLFGVEEAIDLEDLALIAPPGGRGEYAIVVRGRYELRLMTHFDDLVDALTEELDEGKRLVRVTSGGGYNEGAGELTAWRAAFEFVAP
jgi:hypothetical protein